MERETEETELEHSKLIFAIVRIAPLEKSEVHTNIEDSQTTPFRTLILDEAGICRHMHSTCREELIKLLKEEESSYTVGKPCIDADENGPYIIKMVEGGKIEFEDQT